MAIPLTKLDLTATSLLKGERSVLYFIPNGVNPYTGTAFSGADSTTSVPKGVGIICTQTGMDAIPMTPITSETYKANGKNDYVLATGAMIEDFNVMVDAGTVKTLKVMMGEDPSSASANSLVLNAQQSVSGHLFVQQWNASDLKRSIFIPDMQVKITEIVATGAPDDRLTQNITFFKPSAAEVYITEGTKSFYVGFWKDHSINSGAPDGIIVDFTAGTGNYNAAAGTASVVPLKINDNFIAQKFGSSATDFDKYWIRVAVNGTTITNASATYTTGTKKITFGTAPAAAASLLAIGIIDYATATPENWSNGVTSVVEAMQLGWESYA